MTAWQRLIDAAVYPFTLTEFDEGQYEIARKGEGASEQNRSETGIERKRD